MRNVLYTKSQTLFKKLDNFRYSFRYKKPYTLRYGIFMKFLKLAFLYKKHDTLRYVTFLYTKSQTLHKKLDNYRCVFLYKKQYTLRCRVFHEIFEVCIYIQKAFHFGLRDVFIYKKLDTWQKLRQFAIRFIYKNPTLCVP